MHLDCENSICTITGGTDHFVFKMPFILILHVVQDQACLRVALISPQRNNTKFSDVLLATMLSP